MIMRSVGTSHFDSKPGLQDWHPELGVKTLWLLLEKSWAEHQAMGLPRAWLSHRLCVFRTPVLTSFSVPSHLLPPRESSYLRPGGGTGLGTEKSDLGFICNVTFL